MVRVTTYLEVLEVRLPAPAAVDGGGALVGGEEGVEGLAQRQQTVVEAPHPWKRGGEKFGWRVGG